jgi:hypothetical protein
MTKEFSIPCSFGAGGTQNVVFYIGAPSPDKHPIHFQAAWLQQVKGGTVPPDIMQSIQKLYELADKHKISFEELCYYAINVASGKIPNDNKKFAAIMSEA